MNAIGPGGIWRCVGPRRDAHVLSSRCKGGQLRRGQVGAARICESVLILVTVADDQISTFGLHVVGGGVGTAGIRVDHQSGQLWNEINEVNTGHVFIAVKVGNRSGEIDVSDQQMVIHRGRTGPVDLIGSRSGVGNGPRVGIDGGDVDGGVHVLRLREIELPLIVVQDQPSNAVSAR